MYATILVEVSMYCMYSMCNIKRDLTSLLYASNSSSVLCIGLCYGSAVYWENACRSLWLGQTLLIDNKNV